MCPMLSLAATFENECDYGFTSITINKSSSHTKWYLFDSNGPTTVKTLLAMKVE